MPRARRIDYPGAWHHVMNRTIDSIALFTDDTDRRIFMTELREALNASQAKLHGYCLMSNHYHLLIHTPAGRLSDAMQQSVSAFTQKINFRRDRDGPIFRGRFTSVLPDDDSHLVNISAYIHLNPVKAGLVTSPEDWPWSSAGAYFGTTVRQYDLQTDAILELFDPNGGTASYRQFVMERQALGSAP